MALHCILTCLWYNYMLYCMVVCFQHNEIVLQLLDVLSLHPNIIYQSALYVVVLILHLGYQNTPHVHSVVDAARNCMWQQAYKPHTQIAYFSVITKDQNLNQISPKFTFFLFLF